MPDISIDKIQIEIDADAKNASDGLEKLANMLEKLKNSIGVSATKMTEIADSLLGMTKASRGIESLSQNIKVLVDGLEKMSNLKSLNLSKITKDISGLKTSVSSFDIQSVSKISQLGSALTGLSNISISNLRVGKLAKDIGSLTSVLYGISESDFDKLRQMASAMSLLNNSTSAQLSLRPFANSLKKISDAIITLPQDTVSRLTNLNNAIVPMGNITSDFKGIKNLASAFKRLAEMDISKLESNLKNINAAITPLIDNLSRINNVIPNMGAFTSSLKSLSKAQSMPLNKNVGGMNSIDKLFDVGKIATIIYSIKRLSSGLARAIDSTNSYVENMNLFTVAMGEFAAEGDKFANTLQRALGINAGEVMRNMGIFQQMTTAFGVTNDKAYILSKNLTQLGYDISSFYNIKISDSFLKLESAISGELEPLRRLGYDISEARLQQEAYNLGIRENIKNLSQADKALLRYNTIMKQSTNVFSDMARTLITPANSLRVLQSQFEMTKRAIGSIFIPMLMKILPVVIAVIEVIGQLAATVAATFGFEMPKIDYSGIGNGLGTVDTALDDVADSAGKANKEMNYLIGGFDELNIMNKNIANSGIGGIGGAGGILGDITLPEYDMLEGLNKEVREAIDKLKVTITNFFNSFVENPAIQALTNAIKFLWENAIKPLGEWIMSHPDIFANFIVAIGAAIIAYKLVSSLKGITGVITGGSGLFNALKLLVPILSNPWALAIAAVAGSFILIFNAMNNNFQAKKAADLAARFGDIALSLEEIRIVAGKLTTSDLTLNLELYYNENEKLAGIQSSIESSIETLNKYNWMVSVGLSLTPDEIQNYKTEIDNYVNKARQYLVQKQYTVSIALDILLGDSGTGARLKDFANKFYAESQDELTRLGEELRKTVNDSFADGILSPDEAKTIANLQREMQLILEKTANAEFKAKLKALELDISGIKLTPESFKSVVEQANKNISEQMTQLEGVRLEGLKWAEIEFDNTKDTTLYEKTVRDIEQAFQNNKFNLDIQTFEFSLNTLYTAFESEIDTFEPVISTGVNKAFKNGFFYGINDLESVYQQPISSIVANVSKAYITDMNLAGTEIDKAARQNLKDTLKVMEPQQADLIKISEDSKKLGQALPQGLAKGIVDVESLKAMTGNIESMRYLIGMNLTSDAKFLELLSTSEGAGKEIDKSIARGLTDNIVIVTDETTGMINSIRSATNDTLLEITPTLLENMRDLGYNISDSLVSSSEKHLTDSKERTKMNFAQVVDWVKEVFDINSPSGVFLDFGEMIIKGLLNGISENWWSIVDWWDTAIDKWWGDSVEPWFDIKRWIEVGTGMKEGLIQSFKNAITAAIAMFNKFIDKVNSRMRFSWDSLEIAGVEIFPSGSIQLFTIPHIPSLAKGGVLYNEAIVRVGEYPNSNSNPEIISPQSIIYDTVVDANSQLADVFFQVGKMIINAINEKDMNVSIDSDSIGEASVKYINDTTNRTGRTPVKV